MFRCSEDEASIEVPRSNEGSLIVYEEHTDQGIAQIVMMNSDGTGRKVLTPSSAQPSQSVAQDIGPKLSLDRTKIVYSSNRGQVDNGYDIMMANADGSNFINLTNTPNRRESEPDISSDGTIVFCASDDAGITQLFLRDNDGSNERQLTFLTGSPSSTYTGTPNFSEKGDKVVFVAVTAESPQYNVYRIDVDGTNLINLSNSATISSFQGAQSPDGKTIVFARRDQSNHQELFTMNPDGTGVKQLTDFTNPNVTFLASGDPCWSPDGKKIAFVSNKDKTGNNQGYDIYVMDADGKNVVRLTNTNSTKYYPDWN